MKKFSYFSLLVVFAIFLIMGLYYLFGNPQYVGGDAYNFIISACKATASFVVAFGSLISALLIGPPEKVESKEETAETGKQEGV